MLVVFVIVLAGGIPTAAAQARAANIESFTVEATVNPDGSMDVVETLAYNFDGDFNGGTRSIPPASGDQRYEIGPVTVTEDGEPRDLNQSDPAALRWFGSADHEQVTGRHTYELRYTVTDAVAVFNDVALLEWMFVGRDFPSLAEVSIDVTVPGDGTGVRAFASGPLTGVINSDGPLVTLRVLDNPAGQFVEARIVVPAQEFTAPPRENIDALPGILEEEGRLADEANAEREDARQRVIADLEDEIAEGRPAACDDPDDDLRRPCDALNEALDEGEVAVAAGDESVITAVLAIRDARTAVGDVLDDRIAAKLRAVGNVVGPAAGVAGLGAFFVIWRRWGREPERPADIGDYWRELPTESPAVIGAVESWGGVETKAFASIVIDLAQRGWLTITEEARDGFLGDSTEFRFTRSGPPTDDVVRPYEAAVLARVFAGGGRDSVTQEELKREAELDRTGSAAWISELKRDVATDYGAQGYESKNGCLPWVLHGVVVLVVLAAGAGAAALGSPVGATAIAVAVVLLVLSPLLRQRTDRGARKLAEVQGLRRFLKDFSLVDDVPIGHLALYERYLVFAVALGVADDLLRGLRTRFPELASQDSGFATWYVAGSMMGSGGYGGSFDRLSSVGNIGTFANDFTSDAATAFSPPASSSGSGFSGGGGGFSGGGGGGGGGGGAGGW
ncbi:MAG: DUF2207 domain-containing protein [Acidimicrobiia bacterium]|nr:DUF2207 domain-containing protein [Acidimicrobiia bacterium]